MKERGVDIGSVEGESGDKGVNGRDWLVAVNGVGRAPSKKIGRGSKEGGGSCLEATVTGDWKVVVEVEAAEWEV